MLDPTVQQIGIGGVVAVALVTVVLKFLPAFMAALRHQNGKNKSGDLTPTEWEGRMREIAHNANEELMGDMRKLLDERLRDIIRDEMKRRVR